ncbi:MAG: type I methionyl aminopeptidase [Bacteroidia bacterium]|jgi:methionyl aminopeptidase
MAFRDVGSKIIIKTEAQIDGIRKSSQLAGNTLKAVAPYVKAGVTTEYLNKICADYIRDHKARAATLGYNGYPKESCISVNDVICHGIPGKLELRDGDIVNIDVTTILDGFFGDTSTMFMVGEVTEHARQLIDVTRTCLNLGIAQCLPGKHVGDIGYEINKYATSFGYGVVYEFCGHGVGLKFHEEPEICHVDEKGRGAIFQPGMIFTIEPMINAGKARARIDKKDHWTARTIDGKLSAQFEHTILVTSTIPEVLTDADHVYPKPEKTF